MKQECGETAQMEVPKPSGERWQEYKIVATDEVGNEFSVTMPIEKMIREGCMAFSFACNGISFVDYHKEDNQKHRKASILVNGDYLLKDGYVEVSKILEKTGDIMRFGLSEAKDKVIRGMLVTMPMVERFANEGLTREQSREIRMLMKRLEEI